MIYLFLKRRAERESRSALRATPFEIRCQNDGGRLAAGALGCLVKKIEAMQMASIKTDSG
ncbi:hypothetical protein HNR77_004063 [Paenibacillus sp. JGP012]|uniref:hypothetical protein n=1 Tax=Paenibacillus sp. JGP012 TaxID=2735914 RepID=UPI00161DC1A9|nr:hypothetical protein [Paenibacillus sp. JGP012]MBB6022964.1 hypothetical protein [Paenibacillus sp. JGP012]